MPDSTDLMALARLLATMGSSAGSNEDFLRRAASTAYYAVFHHVLRIAALRFMGSDKEERAGYTLLYRGFQHGRMRSVCLSLQSVRLGLNLQRRLGRVSISQKMRQFAGSFVLLQDGRQHADYDPSTVFTASDATDLITEAELAIQAFDRADTDERTDILALMLVTSRE